MRFYEALLRETLVRFEAAWRSHGALIADHLAPGATAEHLDSLEARLGYPIPPELRVWWQWHDGVHRVGEGTHGPESVIGPGGDFLSSTEAVKDVEGELVHNPLWQASWLTVVRYDAYSLFVDCRDVTEVGTVPVRKYEHIPDDLFTPRAGCFTAAVMIWTELIEQGVYQWVDGQLVWELYVSPRIPRSLKVFGPL